MDKKKVIELIEDTILMVDTIEGFDDGDTEQLLSIRHKLNEALDELQKSDWIAVEDELPEYGEDVIVCNNIKPKKVWMAYRSERDYFKKDDNDFVLHGDYEPSITRWRKVDKLEV